MYCSPQSNFQYFTALSLENRCPCQARVQTPTSKLLLLPRLLIGNLAHQHLALPRLFLLPLLASLIHRIGSLVCLGALRAQPLDMPADLLPPLGSEARLARQLLIEVRVRVLLDPYLHREPLGPIGHRQPPASLLLLVLHQRPARVARLRLPARIEGNLGFALVAFGRERVRHVEYCSVLLAKDIGLKRRAWIKGSDHLARARLALGLDARLALKEVNHLPMPLSPCEVDWRKAPSVLELRSPRIRSQEHAHSVQPTIVCRQMQRQASQVRNGTRSLRVHFVQPLAYCFAPVQRGRIVHGQEAPIVLHLCLLRVLFDRVEHFVLRTLVRVRQQVVQLGPPLNELRVNWHPEYGR
eukprot:scaffold54171_cov69-Phaeocystis_antarctica.AAC.4